MREPLTSPLELLRNAPPDMPALQALVRRYVAILEPYQDPPSAAK
jgi:predicted LPLAT superfamily acyltransferase